MNKITWGQRRMMKIRQTLKWETRGMRCRVMSEASLRAATHVLNIPLERHGEDMMRTIVL